MAPQTSAEDHLQEADIGIDVRLLDDLMTWIEKEAKFSSEGIIEDERFTEASKPLFQAVDQGKQVMQSTCFSKCEEILKIPSRTLTSCATFFASHPTRSLP